MVDCNNSTMIYFKINNHQKKHPPAKLFFSFPASFENYLKQINHFVKITACSLSVIILILFTGGCTLTLHQSHLAEPAVIMPAVFVEADNRTAALPIDRWWDEFKDQTLNDLIVKALADNLDLAQARARLRQFEALAQISGSAMLPFLNIQARASRDQPQTTSRKHTSTNYNLSLAASYELDLWQRLRRQKEAADFELYASSADIQTLYMILTAQLADLYFLAIEQRGQLILTEQIIATLTDSLTRVERRYKAGLASIHDIHHNRQNLLRAKENQPLLSAHLNVTLHALSLLSGDFPGHDIGGQTAVLANIPPLPAVGLPANLLHQRPDLKAAYLRLAAKDNQIAAAIANRLPSINLFATYGSSQSTLSNILKHGSFWSLITEISAPIIDHGRRKAKVTRSQAVFSEALAAYKQIVIKAVSEVEDALGNNRAAAIRLKHLETRVKVSNAALRLASRKYLEGITDYMPVLTARRLHLETESQTLSARRQLITERISLFRALGGGTRSYN